MADSFDQSSEDLFGSEYEIWHDGLDEARLDRLSHEDRDGTLAVLAEGLRDGEWLAPLAARKLGASQFLSDVESGLEGTGGRYASESARAIVALGGDADVAKRRQTAEACA